MVKVLLVLLLSVPGLLSATPHSPERLSQTTLKSVSKQYSFKIVGETTLSFLFWDLYTSKLLTTSGNYPIDTVTEKLIFEINYLTDITKNDLIKHTVEQWQHLQILEKDYQQFVPQLIKIWPDITKGDTLALLINDQVSVFYFNQNYIGSIESPEFGQIFIDIWLANNTSKPTLRLELLGGNKHD